MTDESPTTEDRGRTRSVLIILSVLIAAAIVGLLVVGLTRDSDPLGISHDIADGKKVEAPDFTLPVFANGGSLGPEGTQVSLSDSRGTPVLVNFWADWCAPCHEEAPILERLYQRYGDRVQFITVNSEDEPSAARDFIKRHGVTFPVVRTGDDRVRRSFGALQMPETFVIDRDGTFGMVPFKGQLTVEHEDEIADYLDSVLTQ